MIALAIVTVVLNGVAVPASRPARIIGGTVMVPIDPIVRRIARVVSLDPSTGAIVVEGVHGRITLAIDERAAITKVGVVSLAVAPFRVDSTAFVPLARIVEALGGSVQYDGPRKVAEVSAYDGDPISSPTPFDPSQPRIAPHVVFTPDPAITPRPLLTGIPRPRRTPLEVGLPP